MLSSGWGRVFRGVVQGCAPGQHLVHVVHASPFICLCYAAQPDAKLAALPPNGVGRASSAAA